MLGTYALSSGYYDAYYGQAQRVRTKIADDFRTAFEAFDLVVTPDLADGRLRAGRAHQGPARDVPLRLLHRADVAGGDPRDLDPCGLGEPAAAGCRWASSSPAPRSPRPLLDAAHALEGASGSRGGPDEHDADRRDRGGGAEALDELPEWVRERAGRRRRDRRGLPPRRAHGHLRPGRRPPAHRHLPRRQPQRRGGQAHRLPRGRPLLRDGRGADREPGVMADGYEAVIGLEIHVQLATRTKMFCGCELSFGDDPNVHTCPVCLAHPGMLPMINEQAVQLRPPDRAGARLRDRPALDLPPQEVLLSRQPEGVPDQPVRHPARHERAAGRRPHPPRPPRGGRGEADPRLRVGPDPRLRRLARRLQPRRHAAGRDRHRARPPRRRGGPRVAPAPALDDQGDRRLGREHGGGEPPLRREHLDPPGGHGGAGHQDRAQEHELVPLHRARDRGRARAPARHRGGRRGGDQETLHFDPRSGSLTSLRSKEEAHDYRYFPEPDLVPLAPTEEMLAEARAALPELPGEREARYASELGLPDKHARPARLRPRAGRATSRPWWRRLGRPGTVANWVTGEAQAREVEPAALASLVAMVEDGKVTNQAAKKVSEARRERGRPCRDRRVGRPRRDGGLGRAGRRSSIARWKLTPTRRRR